MSTPVLIRCPLCQHLLNLPEDYLGKVVTCLECSRSFTAPTREGDRLTTPTPLPQRSLPAKILVPLFGLLLLGAGGVMLNGYCYYRFAEDPEAAKGYVRQILRQLSLEAPPEEPVAPAKGKVRSAPPTPEEQARQEARLKEFQDEQEKRIEQRTAELAPQLRPLRGIFLLVSVGILIGGLAFAFRRGYPLAFLGCGLAAINSPDMGCCFPGLVVGVWGFFVLISDEGRQYFGK